MAGASKDVIFLGQNLQMGACAFFSDSTATILSGSTAFDVIKYFSDTGGFEDATKIVPFLNSDGNCIFAMAYKKNPNNPHEANTYVFPVQVGSYPDPDSLELPNALYPNYASYGWTRLSVWDNNYSGFDPDNYVLDDVFHNQFSLYYFDTGLCPFYSRYAGNTMSFTDVATQGYSTILNLRVRDKTTGLYGFNEISMFMPYSDGYINYAPPTYEFEYENQYEMTNIHRYGMCNVLNIDGVSGDIDKFTDDTATTTGIGGGFRPYTDSVWFHDLPQHSFADIGLITMYAPTETQLQNLGHYLWSSDFIDNIKKLINDPLDNIISLGYVPLNVNSIRDSVSRELYVGNMGTGVQMYGLSTQYIKVDMGTVNVPERWKGALDYDPYSHCELYLPAIGYVQIPIAEIMAANVSIIYYVDLFSGDCIAEVGADRHDGRRVIIASHKGNIKVNCALTGKNYGAFYANLMSTAPRAVGNFGVNMAQGNVLGAGSGLVADASQVATSSPRVERSGAYTGSGSVLSGYTPFIVFTQPIQQFPPNYDKYVGYPSYVTRKLSDVIKAGGGFTMVAEVIDNTVPASDEEKKMIEDALKEGVIL